MPVRRIAAVIGLCSSSIEEYERLHAEAWPGVLERLTASNIRNYSIYRMGELLFSYMEYVGDDYSTDMAAMANDPETQRWWELTVPMQKPLEDRDGGEWWKELPEVFHLD